MTDFSCLFHVTCFGALRLVKAVLPAMRSRRSGRRLGSSSVDGLVAFTFFAPYAASNFAMEGLFESCHAVYKGFGVQQLARPSTLGWHVVCLRKAVHTSPRPLLSYPVVLLFLCCIARFDSLAAYHLGSSCAHALTQSVGCFVSAVALSVSV